MIARRNQIDDLRTAATMSFEQAVAIQRRAFEYEQREAQRDALAMPHGPEWAAMARQDVTLWDEQIACTRQALAIYRAAIAAAVEQLRADDLEEYADALESGDYAAHLAF